MKVFISIKYYINLYIVYSYMYRICIVYFPLIIVYVSLYSIYGIRYTIYDIRHFRISYTLLCCTLDSRLYTVSSYAVCSARKSLDFMEMLLEEKRFRLYAASLPRESFHLHLKEHFTYLFYTV